MVVVHADLSLLAVGQVENSVVMGMTGEPDGPR
jgi:hypothetical protein